MKTLDILSRAGKSLRQAKVRTFLTSFAIGIGAFAVTLSAMAGEGVRHYVSDTLSSSVNPKMISIYAQNPTSMDMNSYTGLKEYDENNSSEAGYSMKMLSQADVDKLIARTDIEDVQPNYSVVAKYVEFSLIPNKKYNSTIAVQDTTIKYNTVSGRALEIGKQMSYDEIILPKSYIESLGKSVDEVVGSRVKITVQQQASPNVSESELMNAYMSGGSEAVNKLTSAKELTKEFTVRGILDPETENNGINQSSNSMIISPQAAKELQEFSTKGTSSYQKYSSVTALMKNENDAASIKTSLSESGYYAMTAEDFQGVIFGFINVLQAVVMGFGILALFVSVFGIINTMYISVLERTQQIGLMKALGASRKDIGRLFRYEAAWVGLIGAAFGVFAAWVAGIVLNPIIAKALDIKTDLMILVPWQAGIVVVVIVLVAILSGWLPSRKASKLDPIEALRTE